MLGRGRRRHQDQGGLCHCLPMMKGIPKMSVDEPAS